MRPLPPGVVVVGVGNADCGDDAAGLAAARAVAALELPGVRVEEGAGGGLDLLELWAQAHAVIVVDAMRSGLPAGTVRRFEVGRHAASPLPSVWARTSSHILGVSEAVELGRLLGRLPPRLTVYGIEAASAGMGAPLSSVAVAGVRRAVGRIVEEIWWLSNRQGALCDA